MGILNIVTYIPLVGAIVLLFLPKNNPAAIRWGATVFAVVDFLVSIYLWTNFDPKASVPATSVALYTSST